MWKIQVALQGQKLLIFNKLKYFFIISWTVKKRPDPINKNAP